LDSKYAVALTWAIYKWAKAFPDHNSTAFPQHFTPYVKEWQEKEVIPSAAEREERTINAEFFNALSAARKPQRQRGGAERQRVISNQCTASPAET